VDIYEVIGPGWDQFIEYIETLRLLALENRGRIPGNGFHSPYIKSRGALRSSSRCRWRGKMKGTTAVGLDPPNGRIQEIQDAAGHSGFGGAAEDVFRVPGKLGCF